MIGHRIKVAAIATVLAVMSLGCSTGFGVVKGETPAQVFYEVTGYNVILGEAALAYANLLTADPDAVRVMLRYSQAANEQTAMGKNALFECFDRRDAGISDCTQQDQVVAIANAALLKLNDQLRRRLAKEGVNR